MGKTETTKEERARIREMLVKQVALKIRKRQLESKIPCVIVQPGQHTRLENGLLGNGRATAMLNGVPVNSKEEIEAVGTYCMPAILEYLKAKNLKTSEISPKERYFMDKDFLKIFFNAKNAKKKLGDLLN